nr:Peptide chain release factor 3 [Candidatus Anoxychlamydiales bacterium]
IQILYNQNQFNSTFYGAVGRLQFEVLQYRLQDEYKVETNLELLPYQCSSWIIGDIDTYKKPFNSIIVKDRWENLMVLFNSSWEKQYAIQQNPNHQFIDVKY